MFVSCLLHSHLRTYYKLEVQSTPTPYLESWFYHLLFNLGKILAFSCLSFFRLQSGKVTANTSLIISHSTDYRNDSNYSDNFNKTYRELSRFQGITIYIISATQEPSGYAYTNFCLDDVFACHILQKLYLPNIIFLTFFFWTLPCARYWDKHFPFFVSFSFFISFNAHRN